jgi:membrane associated rhomboid family serine protease
LHKGERRVIPLTDRNPTRRLSYVCVILIALNLAVFLYDRFSLVTVQMLAQDQYGRFFVVKDQMGSLSYRFALIPAYVTGQFPPDGSRPLTPLGVQPAWLTLFTSMFLHANWLHVGGNMLYLWIFGNNIEDALGRFKFLLFYLACGLGAGMIHILSGTDSIVPTVGASGAVAGLMGAYVLLYPHARVLSLVPILGIISTLLEVPAIWVIGYWFVIQIVNSTWLRGGEMLTRGGGVAYMAHIGGFVFGLLFIMLLGGKRLAVPQEEHWHHDDRRPREEFDR